MRARVALLSGRGQGKGDGEGTLSLLSRMP